MASKKKAKSQIKHEDSATKFGADVNETGETAEDSSQVKAKKSRKRKMSFEEDIIDGFLMVSYASLEDLEVCYFESSRNGRSIRDLVDLFALYQMIGSGWRCNETLVKKALFSHSICFVQFLILHWITEKEYSACSLRFNFYSGQRGKYTAFSMKADLNRYS